MTAAGSAVGLVSMRGLARLATTCNDDETFTRWAAGLTGTLCLVVDEHSGWLRFENGSVVATGTGDVPAAVRISGTTADWQRICDGVHGGLHRAWRHQWLAFTGDQRAFMRHYKAWFRMGELMAADRSDR